MTLEQAMQIVDAQALDFSMGERQTCFQKLPIKVGCLLATEWLVFKLSHLKNKPLQDKVIESAFRWMENPSEENQQTAYEAGEACLIAWNADSDEELRIAGRLGLAIYMLRHKSKGFYFYTAGVLGDLLKIDVCQFGRRTYERCKGPEYPFNPKWRTDTAVALAQGMWNRRKADCLHILADALQDAGCEDYEVLTPMIIEPETGLLSEWAVWNLLSFNS